MGYTHMCNFKQCNKHRAKFNVTSPYCCAATTMRFLGYYFIYTCISMYFR